MSNCPNCGGDVGRGRWVTGGCTCRREQKRTEPIVPDANPDPHYSCPVCGGRYDLGSRIFGGYSCKCDRDAVDDLLDVGRTTSWIPGASDLTGTSKTVFVLACLIVIVAIFASHGVLWG